MDKHGDKSLETTHNKPKKELFVPLCISSEWCHGLLAMAGSVGQLMHACWQILEKPYPLPRGLNNSFFGRVGTLHWVQFNVA